MKGHVTVFAALVLAAASVGTPTVARPSARDARQVGKVEQGEWWRLCGYERKIRIHPRARGERPRRHRCVPLR